MAGHPQIYFFGDVHGQFQHVVNIVQRDSPDAIILLGDLEPTRPLNIVLAPILDKTIIRYVHGNHDTDSWSSYQHVFQSHTSSWNLHGRVEEICGIRFAGLGGVFRQRVWMPPTPPLYSTYTHFWAELNASRPKRERKASVSVTTGQEREHASTIFPDAIDQLAKQKADILLTHEAPSCHPKGFVAIDDLARTMGVCAAYHGHHHRYRAYRRQWLALGFRAYGVGLRGVARLRAADLAPLVATA